MDYSLKYDVVIVGGGLAGLTSAISLSKANLKVLLIEKKSYPFHKVCGEYISNEIKPFLHDLGVNFNKLETSSIRKIRVSAPNGKSISAKLNMGGFGISRYELDQHLAQIAIKEGAELLLNTRVNKILFEKDKFNVTLHDGKIIESKLVIGTYSKPDLLDDQMQRPFIEDQTGYMAVKYHIKTDYPEDEIGLDNFHGGYCGISKIEKDLYSLCYLTKKSNMKNFKTISEMEENILFKNPWLKWLFRQSTFLFNRPFVTNEVSFTSKSLVENHIIMCGDSPGLISPLGSNGISMAINGAKILSNTIINLQINKRETVHLTARMMLERQYQMAWKKQFSERLSAGKAIHTFFDNPLLINTMLNVSALIPPLKNWMISKTHGAMN